MERWRSAHFLFYPREERRLVLDGFAELHRARMRYLVPVLFFLSLFLLGSDITQMHRDPTVHGAWYLRLDIGMVAIQVAASFLVFVWLRSRPGVPDRFPRWVVVGYTALCLFWAACVAAIEMQQTGNATTIVISVMAASMLLLVSFLTFCVLVLGSVGLFLVLTFVLPGKHSFELVMFVVSLVVVSVFASRSLFSALAENIIARRRLAAMNEELHAVQASLIQREKLAAIGQLSAGIVHEINNPLGFLKSNVSMLEQYWRHIARGGAQPKEDPAYAHLLASMDQIFLDTNEGFRRISEVIENLRAFSHSPQPGSYGSYDLNKGLESALVIARSSYKGFARIERDLGPVTAVEARGSEINQVLLNLILNAAHAVEGSGQEGRITVRTWQEEGAVCCDVSDTGPGVPEEIRGRIFDPFFTTRRSGEGLGLGLSLSWEIIVNRHHGSLQLLEGSPTTFRITLPLRQPAG